jgi:hypothetical protein
MRKPPVSALSIGLLSKKFQTTTAPHPVMLQHDNVFGAAA